MKKSKAGEPEDHPQPQWTSRHPWPSDVAVPSAVQKLAEKAREWGWDVRLGYARGYGVKKYRGEWQLEENISVNFGRHPLTQREAVAVYRTIAGRGSWSWVSVWVWGPDLPAFGAAGMTELQEWLEVGGQVSTSWYGSISARRAAAEVQRKEREKAKRASGVIVKKPNRKSEEAS